MALEQIGKNSDEGCKVVGNHKNVLSGLGTTRTLTADESGSLVLFDTAAGLSVTLPAPVVGMTFDFVATITGTGAYEVVTDAATTFLTGGVGAFSTAVAEGGDSFVADGTSDVRMDMDADTKGRLKGTAFTATCISSTVWAISGTTHGVGTLATPFA